MIGKINQLRYALDRRYVVITNALNSTGHITVINLVDATFGGYCILLLLLSGIAVWRGEGHFITLVVIGSFTLVNFIVSRISIQSMHTPLVEIARIGIGTVIAPSAYIYSAAPFDMWWQGFLIMSTGGAFLVTLLSGKALWGRILVLYYAVLMVGCMFIRGRMVDLYMTLNNAGVIIMIGFVMVEMVSLVAILILMKVVGLQNEIKMAADHQLGMLPKNLPKLPGYETAAILKMTREAGGDLYDILQLNEKEFVFVIGDVSGKGMPAALYMSAALNILRTEIVCLTKISEGKELSPGELLTIINMMMKNTTRAGNFVTMFIGILNTETHELRYTSGGHDPGIVWNPRTQRNELLNTEGQACGAVSPILFNRFVEERRTTIYPGDYVIWNTDGITEAKNKGGIDYTVERYHKKIKELVGTESPQTVLENVIKDVEAFVGAANQYDDIALLCLKRGE